MPILGVIFDLGHTLMYLNGTWPEMFERGTADLAAFLDSQHPPLWTDSRITGLAFAQAFLERRREGYARAQETLREVTAEESVHWTFARFGLPDPPAKLVDGAGDAFFAHEEESWRAYPAALPVLGTLAGRGLRLGLFSNATSDRFIQRLIDRFSFHEVLAPALSSGGTGIRKPDPAALEPILAAWNLPPRSVLMVGDSLEDDILGAQRAGVRSVWIPSRDDARQEGRSPEERLLAAGIQPDRSISGLADLPACLEEMEC
jgi:HAD superfamily hydrolase (TIGR01549 family)